MKILYDILVRDTRFSYTSKHFQIRLIIFMFCMKEAEKLLVNDIKQEKKNRPFLYLQIAHHKFFHQYSEKACSLGKNHRDSGH